MVLALGHPSIRKWTMLATASIVGAGVAAIALA